MTASTREIIDALSCGRRGCSCERAARRGRGLVHCPAHDDGDPSLSTKDEHGKPLFHCFSGCSNEAIIAALLRMGMWGSERPATPLSFRGRWAGEPVKVKRTATGAPKGKVVAVYDYEGDQRKRRFEPKSFDWQHKDERGQWVAGKGATPAPLYHRGRLHELPAGSIVVLSESEKDVHACEERGLHATCGPSGSSGWPDGFAESLRGMRVILPPHNDDPGRKCMRAAAAALQDVAASVYVADFSDQAQGFDVADLFAAGGTVEDLLLRAVPVGLWDAPERPEIPNLAHDLELAQLEIRLLTRERDEALEAARARRAEINTIGDLCASTDLDPVAKVPIIAFTIAGTHDPHFAKAHEMPVDLFNDKFTEMTGIKDPKTIKKAVETLDAGNLITITWRDYQPKGKRRRNGQPIDSHIKMVQLGPREGEEPLTLQQRAALLVHPTDPRLQPKGWGKKRPPELRTVTVEVCKVHLNAPHDVTCSVCGEKTFTIPARTDDTVGNDSQRRTSPFQVAPPVTYGNLSPADLGLGGKDSRPVPNVVAFTGPYQPSPQEIRAGKAELQAEMAAIAGGA